MDVRHWVRRQEVALFNILAGLSLLALKDGRTGVSNRLPLYQGQIALLDL